MANWRMRSWLLEHHHHRKDQLQGLAKAVWQEHRTSCPWDVSSTPRTPRCKYGRHPARNSHLTRQAVAILPWLWGLRQEAALPALACVSLWHRSCPARSVYSAFLAAHLNVQTFLPSIAQVDWESAETRLRAAIEANHQRANAGQVLPQSMGIPRARARLSKSLVTLPQEPGAPPGSREERERQQEHPRF